jgi:hypothetical protein
MSPEKTNELHIGVTILQAAAGYQLMVVANMYCSLPLHADGVGEKRANALGLHQQSHTYVQYLT